MQRGCTRANGGNEQGREKGKRGKGEERINDPHQERKQTRGDGDAFH